MKNRCDNCIHYRQHYSLDEKRLFKVYCGHCVLNVRTKKRPDAIACEKFVHTPPNESPFVSKEYLSKALLNYMMGLELLPAIEEKTDL